MQEEDRHQEERSQGSSEQEDGGSSQGEEDEEPTYAPGSPTPEDPGIDDFEPEPESELDEDEDEDEDDDEDEDEPDDPSAEIIQLEDLDKKTVSQHRKAFVNWINTTFSICICYKSI